MYRGLALVGTLWLLLASRATAHPLTPVAVSLAEGAPNVFALQLRHPSRLHTVQLSLPASCTLSAGVNHNEDDQTFERGTLRCAHTLTGQTLAITGLQPELATALVHILYRDGESVRGVLSLEQPRLTIPQRSSLAQVLMQFGRLGATHMLQGFDHLLFTCGLLLLGLRWRALWLLTAFTLGHSVTLGLLTWGGLSLPRAPVEIGIALSLIGLASSVLGHAPGQSLGSLRGAALLTFAVGLLHGLGFADGLQQLALPTRTLWPALLGFNLGVELAQLLVVALLAPLLWLLSRSALHRQQLVHGAAGYLIGSLAAMWCIERTLELF